MSPKCHFLLFLTVLLNAFAYGQSGELERLKKDVEEKSTLAQAATKEALRQKYLNAAHNAAVGSLDVEDKELTSLLAVQSNTINKNSGGYPYDAQIYNALSNALKRQGLLPKDLSDPTQPSHTLIGVRNGTLYSIGKTGEVVRWTQSNNEWMSEQVLIVHMDVPFTSIDVSPDARTVVIGRPSKTKGSSQAELYELGSTQKDPRIISGLKSTVSKIIFTPDGNGFYALHNDGISISYASLSTAKEVVTAKEPITTLALSTDGTRLAGTSKKVIHFWSTKDFTSHQVALPGEDNQISAVEFLPGQQQLVVGDVNGGWRIVEPNTETGAIRRSYTNHGAAIRQISFNANEMLMATAAANGTVRVWNFSKANQAPIKIQHTNSGGSLSFSPDGKQLLFTGDPGAKKSENDISRIILNPKEMADLLCRILSRTMTKDEWESFFGDLSYEKTCESLPTNNK